MNLSSATVNLGSYMRKVFSYLLMALVLSACHSTGGYTEVVEVKVWAPDSVVSRVITDTEDLEHIESVWNRLDQLEDFPSSEDLSRLNWYKLDVVNSSNRLGGRWLYDRNGYLMYLTITATPIYVIDEIKAFNEALGL